MNCDYSFGNLYNWGFYYKTEVSFHKGMMVVRFESEEGQRPAYLMPIPESSDLPEERVAEVLEDMELSMLSNGHPLTIMAVSAEGVDFLRKTYPELLHVLSSRDYSDYVYLRERLATLSGKKLQKRRNHVNRFRKQYPDYQYEEISDANVEECYQLEREWYDQSAQSSDITEERRMVETALREYKEIGLMGGAIRAEGKIIAFSLGMAINPDCFGVHIEKADPSIDGAFAIMTQEFAKHIPEQYTYVNREEDLGVEGLRRAKLALRPVKILDKHTVMMTYDPEGECR
ncbi:MAG: phosphatidylglycerol lysyltransferase domain-containing protein [Porphyromonas sp.]|nr:phosphatidylglycerol lysyltransferase domain-containing protein [Porphyromonas sp.]